MNESPRPRSPVTHPLRLLTFPASVALAATLLLPADPALAGTPGGSVVERFERDPLTGQSGNPFFQEGDVQDHFVYLSGEPSHFPGDRAGSLRVVYDTTVPAGRVSTPLGRMLSIDEDFGFGAILTIRSEGFDATPDGFDQIAFGLWNASTTGLGRTSFPSDSFDLIEFDYFPNVSPLFGGPFFSPSVFGGNNGGNAFFNFAFQSVQAALPLDTPLLCRADYASASRRLTVTASRLGRGGGVEQPPVATVAVDLANLQPGFLTDVLGIAAYFEGFPSLHAVVDYDLLYFGSLPAPWGNAKRRAGAARHVSRPGQPATPPKPGRTGRTLD